MATVTVNVQANTSDATQDVNKLDTALEGAEKSAEELSSSLEKQEARIKTLGGAINIVGGSVELLAGSLALTGALTEEQAQRFESAAIGAIAFADGSKRVFEGVKELNEGLSGLGGIAGVATKAFNRLKLAILANPYLAIGAAIATAAAAIYTFIQATKDADDTAEDLNTTLDKQIALYQGVGQAALGADVKLAQLQASAKARNITIEEAIRLEKERAIAVRDASFLEELRLKDLRGNQRLDQELLEKQITAETLRRENAQGALDLLVATEVAYKNLGTTVDGVSTEPIALVLQPKFITPKGDKVVNTISDYFAAATAGGEGAKLAPIILPVTSSVDLGETTLLERFEVFGGKIGEAMGGEIANGIGSSLDAAQQLTSALVEVIDDGTKEGFEASKKYKIAEVVTSSTQAAFQAFAAAQQFGPILGPILGAAQVATIATAGNRAIGDIRSSSFNSTSISGGGGGSVSLPTFGQGTTTAFGATGTLNAPTVGSAPPVRAYVVTGDVTAGIDAEYLLNTRRQFP